MKNEKQIKSINNEAIAANPRSINTLTKIARNMNSTQNIKTSSTSNLINLPVKLKGSASNFKGSFTNLNKGSYTNLKGSYTNLKGSYTNLKGSYTNLRPVGKYLPQEPKLNTLSTQSVQNERNELKVEQVMNK